jgi:hypothetical protein
MFMAGTMIARIICCKNDKAENQYFYGQATSSAYQTQSPLPSDFK